jgi:hypothetical protein
MSGGDFRLMCLPELFKVRVICFFLWIQKWKGYGLSPIKGRRQGGRRGCRAATVHIGHVKGGRRMLYGVNVYRVL